MKRIPTNIRRLVYSKYDGHCAYCGKPIEYKDMQVDHIKPVFHNWSEEDKIKLLPEGCTGNDSLDNLNPSCRACNFYKSTLTTDKLKQELGKILGRLDKVFIYRLAKSYGLIEEHPQEIKFYYEQK